MNDDDRLELEPFNRLRDALDSPAFARFPEGERTRIEAEVAELAVDLVDDARLAASARALAMDLAGSAARTEPSRRPPGDG